MLKKNIIALIITIAFATTQAQHISNIQPKLIGNNMQVSYEITGAKFNQIFTVDLYVSVDNGKTYQGPMALIQNDKEVIKSGINTLVWNIFEDVEYLDQELFFSVRATVIEEKIKKNFFIQYSGGALISNINYITPIGFRLGMVGNTGWYVAGYFNTFETANYNYNGETMDKDMFYEFTDQTLYPRMSVTAGVTFQLGWNSYVYAGAGFATQKGYNQINELELDGTVIGKQWVNMTEQETAGVEIEAGTILNFNKLSISLGLSTFNFKHIGANVGIGLVF